MYMDYILLCGKVAHTCTCVVYMYMCVRSIVLTVVNVYLEYMGMYAHSVLLFNCLYVQ